MYEFAFIHHDDHHTIEASKGSIGSFPQANLLASDGGQCAQGCIFMRFVQHDGYC